MLLASVIVSLFISFFGLFIFVYFLPDEIRSFTQQFSYLRPNAYVNLCHVRERKMTNCLTPDEWRHKSSQLKPFAMEIVWHYNSLLAVVLCLA